MNPQALRMLSVTLTQPLTAQFNYCQLTNHRHFPLYPATAPDFPYFGRKATRKELETKIQVQLLVHGWSGTRKLAPKLIRRSRNCLGAFPKDLFESVIAINYISRVSRHNAFPLVEILFHSRQT